MDVRALTYLQRPNFTINQQFTCIKTRQNYLLEPVVLIPLYRNVVQILHIDLLTQTAWMTYPVSVLL